MVARQKVIFRSWFWKLFLYGKFSGVPASQRKFDHQLLAVRRAAASKSRLPGSFDGPCIGPPWEPLDFSLGGRSLKFRPLHVSIHIGTIDTHFYPQTIPQYITTRHYDTLVQL